jgi:hypothetical protein
MRDLPDAVGDNSSALLFLIACTNASSWYSLGSNVRFNESLNSVASSREIFSSLELILVKEN